jgi:hypothetical protein
MNAYETAIEQTRCYWRERDIDLTGYIFSATQAPLPGSVWWVEARSSERRYDVLVSRQDKQSFQFFAHCPWGYTIYACYGTGETPLEVVDYESLARERVEELSKSLLYAHASLRYLENPSMVWRDSMRSFLEVKGARKEANHQRKVTTRREARCVDRAKRRGPPQSWSLVPPAHNELMLGMTHALQNSIFSLFSRAFTEAGIPHSPTIERNMRKLFMTRLHAKTCLPFGCMWTPARCLLLVPGDPGSQYEVKCWIRWSEQAYCLWFDGSNLRECSYEDLERLLESKCPETEGKEAKS